MPTFKEIKEDLERVKIISTLTSALQEIAQIRMSEVRENVLKNRIFLEKIAEVYRKAKLAYFAQEKLKKEGIFKKKRVSLDEIFLSKKKKGPLLIFLSANQPFYGIIIYNIWSVVFNLLQKEKTDLAVVGKIGEGLVNVFAPSQSYSYFELNDDKPKPEEIKKIADFAKNYQRVIVVHGKYESILRQQVAISEISGILPTEEKIEKAKHYLFEPSGKEILEFFETEIFTSLLHQTVLEHQLAKFASRVIAMYQASEKAKKVERELELKKIKWQKDLMNKKQINLFSGFQLWQKEEVL